MLTLVHDSSLGMRCWFDFGKVCLVVSWLSIIKEKGARSISNEEF